MKYKFEISIAEIKDLGQGPFEFKIALDSIEQNLYDTDTFEIYGEGNFALGIQSNESVLGGFRVPMAVLHKVSSSWFPLTIPYSDLPSLPESVSGPRVYLTILEISILSPVQERREVSEYSLQSTPQVSSPEAFAFKTEELDTQHIYTAQLSSLLEINNTELSELKELYRSAKKTIEKISEEGNRREEELSKNILNLVELNTRLESENARLNAEQVKYSVEGQSLRTSSVYLSGELEKFKVLFKESEASKKEIQKIMANTQQKIEDFKKKLLEFDKVFEEKQALTSTVKMLSEKIRDLEQHKGSEEKLNSHVSILNNSISSLKLEIVELRKNNKIVQEENNYLKGLFEKSKPAKLEFNSPEIQDSLKHACFNISNANKEEKQDYLDKTLKEYLKDSGIPNPFSKIGEGVYQYGTKKVPLSLKNGVPVIRVGGGFMFIPEFLKIYNGQIKKKTEDEFAERSLSFEGKERLRGGIVSEVDVENYNDILYSTPSESPMKKVGVAYPTKSVVLKKISRLAAQHRDLTPNSRINKTPRQVFLP